MYFIYDVLVLTLAIIFSPIILTAFVFVPKFRAGFWQKIGFYPKIKTDKPVILIHAVSVGEVNAVENLVKTIKNTFENHSIILTTVTRTGNAVAHSKLSKVVDEILYFPYDFSFSVNSLLNAIKPSIAIIAETEIWPNFSHCANKKNIPLMIVNGRISPNSHKGYKKAKFFFSKILDNYTYILTQSRGDADRMIDIGANSQKTEVMGNLKFDITNNLEEDEKENLKNSLKSHEYKAIIAGSTHAGEDEIVLDAFVKLKNSHPDIKLLLAPRHPERHQSVIKLIAKTGLNYGLRSAKDNFENNDIIMLDTMGELGKLYAISYIAFIGGSYSNTGGHNPLEANIFGVPVISGPTVFNFKDIYKLLKGFGCAKIVEQQGFYSTLDEFLSNEEVYKSYSDACKKVFDENSGAISYAIEKIKTLL